MTTTQFTPSAVSPTAQTLSFASFDERAQSGEPMSIVFVGGSITWGAGATEPNVTSYRGRVIQRFRDRYPTGNLRFWDAAIGGTGSIIGALRADRDVFEHQPDLVFLDFTLNDDPTKSDPVTLASYEALMRRILLSDSLVLSVMFPYKDISVHRNELIRCTAHKEIAQRYEVPIADVVDGVRTQIEDGATTPDTVWGNPDDGTHPTDGGYAVYAEVVWDAFEQAVANDVTNCVPDTMLHADTFLTTRRLRLGETGNTTGWSVESPTDWTPWGDFIMSRWFDDVLVGRAAQGVTAPIPLTVNFNGSVVVLFAESTLTSGHYFAKIDDGEPVRCDASDLAVHCGGACHHFRILATDLDPTVPHTLTLTPDLVNGQELRFDSVCSAG